jgi:hypothetical protein
VRTHSELMEAAELLLSRHNEHVGTEARIDVEQFRKVITAAGGTTPEALAEIEVSDLASVENLPALIARAVVSTLRGQSTDAGDGASDEPKAITEEQCREADESWLLGRYDWDRPSSFVVAELTRRATQHGQPARFIVIDGDGHIHRQASLRLLRELCDGHDAVETTPVNGAPCEVLLLGEKPDEYHHEHPLFPGRVLRGQVDEQGRDWVNGLKLETRLVLRLAVGTAELPRPTRPEVRRIFDRYQGEEGLSRAHEDFPEATVNHGKRKEAGALPTLRLQIGRSRRRGEKKLY